MSGLDEKGLADALACYSEGGCMGLNEHERLEVVDGIIRAYLSAVGQKAGTVEDALGGSTTAYTREQLAKLAFVVFYSPVLCGPLNIKTVVDEIDCCPGCEHPSSGGTCPVSERGNYCPNDLAETLRQISVALYGPGEPSHYVPSVFGPDKVTALTHPAPSPVVPSGLEALVERARKIAEMARTAIDTGGREEFDPRGVEDDVNALADAIAALIAERDEAKAAAERQYDENVNRIAAEGAAILRAETAERALSAALNRIAEIEGETRERCAKIAIGQGAYFAAIAIRSSATKQEKADV